MDSLCGRRVWPASGKANGKQHQGKKAKRHAGTVAAAVAAVSPGLVDCRLSGCHRGLRQPCKGLIGRGSPLEVEGGRR
jgi:hypothetical protein